MRPDLTRVGEWYHNYIKLVTEDNLKEAFANCNKELFAFLDSISPDKHDFRYAPEKWTVREVLQHIIDAERVFAYRALRFARKDPTPLAGFDENLYAETSKADKRSWKDLMEELIVVRQSSTLLFNSFDEDQLESGGTASNSPNYVLAIGYTLLGHALHHQHILSTRYL